MTGCAVGVSTGNWMTCADFRSQLLILAYDRRLVVENPNTDIAICYQLIASVSLGHGDHHIN